MIEKQRKFSDWGIKAEFVGEAQLDAKGVKGNLQLLYVSPENLQNNKSYCSMLLTPQYTNSLVALVVDEVKTCEVCIILLHLFC